MQTVFLIWGMTRRILCQTLHDLGLLE
jgi:hypothetical protein